MTRPICLLLVVAAAVSAPFNPAPVVAQSDLLLTEMPYVATQVATDIFVGTVLSLKETVDVGESRYFPQFESIYEVQVGTVVKGTLDDGDRVKVRHRGGEMHGVSDYLPDDGPLLPDQRFLFVTVERVDWGQFEATGYLDSSILLTTADDEAEWVGRWTTAANAGPCAGLLDVIRLNGTVYARRPWSSDKRFLEPEWVGEQVATIERQDYGFYGCSPDLKDGDASILAAGTEVFELKGYDPSFRVAVRLPDKHRWLYEAVWSDNAETGEDLLDIRDRVVSIEYGRFSFCNDRGCVDYAGGYVEDPEIVTGMVLLTLRAPVVPVTDELMFLDEEEIGYMYFNLDDDSPTGIHFNIATGVTTNGIQLPGALVEFVIRGYDTPPGF